LRFRFENVLLLRCLRLRKENEEYRQEFLLLNSKEQNGQIEYLREMVLTTEQKLLEEQNQLKKLKIKKQQRYQSLLNQVRFYPFLINRKTKQIFLRLNY